MKKTLTLLAPLALTATLFADDAAPVRQQSMWNTFMMIGIALVFFYMILWRPEQKRRKKMQQQRSSMKKGDRVTAMGIVGTLDRLDKETATLKMVDGAKIEVLLAAISDVKPAAEAAEKPAEAQKSAT
ncbi:MAG: preprotein translocase subunit YajC [Chlamydiia bacterium]|nr:preprotein translocase subunit YajC [Chlamydiia bacterium]